jgi:uncharacterized protein (TIGR02246 family)
MQSRNPLPLAGSMTRLRVRHATVALLLTVAATASCVHVGVTRGRTAADAAASAAAEIRATLDSTAAGWNRGDLALYLSPYTKDATEMLATGPAGGVEAIEKTMKEGFWKTGRPLQKLHYEHVLVRMLGADGAVVTGQFVLTGADRPDRTGWFTTAWLRTESGWKMIHDHS